MAAAPRETLLLFSCTNRWRKLTTADKSTGNKWSAAEIKQHIVKIQAANEKIKRENKGEHFTSITPAEIEKKFKRVNSPMIIARHRELSRPQRVRIRCLLGTVRKQPIQSTANAT